MGEIKHVVAGWTSVERPPMDVAKNWQGGWRGWMSRVVETRDRDGPQFRGAFDVMYEGTLLERTKAALHGGDRTSHASVLDYVAWHWWTAFCVSWVAIGAVMLVGQYE